MHPTFKYESRMLLGASIAAAIVTCLGCASKDACTSQGPHGLTVSRIVSKSPWAASFAASCVFIGFGMRRALKGAGAPRCGLLGLVFFTLLGTSPDLTGPMEWIHGISLVGPAFVFLVYVFFSKPSLAVKPDRVAIVRAHTIASCAWAIGSLVVVWVRKPGFLRFVGFFSEITSLMHAVASLL